jgi:hypothetical protein
MTQDGRWILISEGTTGSIVRFHGEGGTPSLGARIALSEGLPVHLRADGREAFIVTTDHLLRAVALNLGDETGSLGAVAPLFKIDLASFGIAGELDRHAIHRHRIAVRGRADDCSAHELGNKTEVAALADLRGQRGGRSPPLTIVPVSADQAES